MQKKPGNLEQIKNLLNKQVNQASKINFVLHSSKNGTSVNNKAAQIGIGNFTEVQDIMISNQKMKYIDMDETTPIAAELTINEFVGQRDRNNISCMQFIKSQYQTHQKSKSSSAVTKHVGLNFSIEEPSQQSRAQTSQIAGNGHITTKYSPLKKQAPQSGVSQISLFSQDASNFGEGMTTFYTTNNPKPETNQTGNRKNISISRYQINNDDVEDKNTIIQSPPSHQRILSSSTNITNQNKSMVIGTHINGNQKNSNQKERPHSNNIQQSKSVNYKSRPQTAYLIKDQDKDLLKEQLASKHQKATLTNFNTLQDHQYQRDQSIYRDTQIQKDYSPQKDKFSRIDQQSLERSYQKNSFNSQLQSSNLFIKRAHSAIKDKKKLNSSAVTIDNSNIFDLFDEKKYQLAIQVKQKAIDKFMMSRNPTKVIRNNLLKSTMKKKQYNEGSHNISGVTTIQNSSTNIIDMQKSQKRILQEIIDDMEEEQTNFVQQLVESEQKNFVFSSQFNKTEKIVETKDLNLLAQQLIFLAKIGLIVSDYDKATFFLQQAKILTDMSRKISHLKTQIFLILGEVSLKTNKYQDAILIFKKALQYSWFFDQKDHEIDVYEKLSISYYFLQDLKLTDFYYTRSTKALYELPNSHIRNISNENIQEYFLKCEYNLNSLTPILMVHLSLPVQYSLDKLQQGLRESFLKQEQRQNKRGSNISEKLENLAKESQKQVENFVQSRQKIFNQLNATKIIETLLEEREFEFVTDTPKEFFDITQDQTSQQLLNRSDLLFDSQQKETINKSTIDYSSPNKVIKKKDWDAPVMRKVAYDISKFGPVQDPRPSKRVFEDLNKYKFSLDKKVKILIKQKIDLNKIMEKVNYLVSNNQKYNAQMNQRVRTSHLTPLRFDPMKYNTTYYIIKQINRTYSEFVSYLKKEEQSIKY